MTEKLTEKSKKVIDNTLKMVYIIPCIAAVVRQPDAGKYARVAQWWSTSLPRRGSRVRSPSRALDNKKRISVWISFFIIEKCDALLERMLLCSKGSISRSAKAPLGRARAKVHRTLWHPSRISQMQAALQQGFDFSES